MAMLEVRDLHTSFFTPAGEVKAVNGVSFNLDAGKVLGIVGESGSGKSVTAYSILQILTHPGRIVSGSIRCIPAETPPRRASAPGRCWRWWASTSRKSA